MSLSLKPHSNTFHNISQSKIIHNNNSNRSNLRSNPNSIYVYATETDVNSDNDDLTLIKSNSNYNTEYNSAEEDNHNLNVLQEKKTIKNKYTNKLCTIAANIWGPRFKFYSHSNSLRETLYSFTYQTSFLHLQPR
ncbi:unnamed protein product [Rotaria sp. Silwood2]|nr:unnamed protein product [Rotaria sp. Silwood2]